MSVTAVFNRVEGQALHPDNMIHPRSRLYLRGDQLVDEDGLILAERVLDQDGRVVWRPLTTDNDALWPPPNSTPWLCQEVAIVGQGRLNL